MTKRCPQCNSPKRKNVKAASCVACRACDWEGQACQLVDDVEPDLSDEAIDKLVEELQRLTDE